MGREGVAIDTLADMHALLDGIDLEEISVSLTINPTAWILLAMYIALADERGYDLNKISGTVQADILKEYMAQKEYIFPITPSVRIVRDIISHSTKTMKRYNPINISGYHISEAGSSPLHEAAFTLANLIVYVEEVLKTGVNVDDFASRLAFFFVCQADFFEEIAKFRALRQLLCEDHEGAFWCQEAGVDAPSLPLPDRSGLAHQAAVHGQRHAYDHAGACSAVLGGAQSLHTNGYDEAFAIPTEHAMQLALRTQQRHRRRDQRNPGRGPASVVRITSRLSRTIMRRRSSGFLDEIQAAGGTIKLIEEGWFQEAHRGLRLRDRPTQAIG